MRFSLFILLMLFSFNAAAQNTESELNVETDTLAPVADPKYREDQFYASVTYNLLQNAPGAFSQNSFSTGLTTGFLRDMPLNKSRTYAIAAGLGYSYNNLKHNLKVSELGEVRTYEIAPEADFDKNKLVLHHLELPIEFRWRNSDSISHKFWRVYAGFKVSYLFADKSEYRSGSGDVKVKGNPDLNKFIYGAYLSAGWNTWNLYAYYGLNPIYKSAVLANGQEIKLNALNLGLIFYIL
jgi:hypothetical protein